MTKKTIVITGNHSTPAIELIRQLKKDPRTRWHIEYIGHAQPQQAHLQKTIIPQLKNRFHQLSGGKLNRHQPFKSILTQTPKTIQAVNTAHLLLKKIQPDIVMSFGGYTSVPVAIAAFLQKIPVIVHEQTLTLSLSTRLSAFFARKIALSFPPPQGLFAKIFQNKIIITGNLLRSQIYQKTTSNYKNLINKINQKPLLYFALGRQGSVAVNQNILPILAQLSKKFLIIHHTGKNNLASIKKQTTEIKNYFPTEYIGLDDIGWVLHNSHLIIGRSGANISQEIVQLKKSAILIPLPQSQQNEQLKNAVWVKQHLPQTIIIDQKQLSPSLLLKNIQEQSTGNHTSQNRSIKAVENLQIITLIHQLV